jgi:hypothetical protein
MPARPGPMSVADRKRGPRRATLSAPPPKAEVTAGSVACPSRAMGSRNQNQQR